MWLFYSVRDREVDEGLFHSGHSVRDREVDDVVVL